VESTFGREGKEVAGGRAAIGTPRTAALLAVAVEVPLRLSVAAGGVVVDVGGSTDTVATGGADKVAVSDEVPDTVEVDWPHGGKGHQLNEVVVAEGGVSMRASMPGGWCRARGWYARSYP